VIDVQQPLDISSRAAIATGASSGLRERFARVLAGAGANVVGAARGRTGWGGWSAS
jgi:NADP-dependent 3-hydroxy acid dehydrogenase YdfG